MDPILRLSDYLKEKFPVLSRVLVAGFWVGALAGLWWVVMALQSYLYYESIGREPYRTSHLRIAAKKAVSTILDPFYDSRLVEEGLLPIYDLRMSEKRSEQWRGILRRVYARGFAEAEDQVYMPAVFKFRDLEIEVDIRGRGTLFTHYREEKPSFRIKFPKDRYFRGSRVTNLIIPYDQARVVGDTSVSSLARRYGLVTLPIRFVTLRFNGEVLGVYHEVEHFRKELAVKQFRSEGYFMSSLGAPKGGAKAGDHPGFARALEAFSHCVNHPCADAEVRRVLDEFVDVDKMAIYSAITTLFGAKHGWGEDNLILFFDPPRGRLEPVPWDMGTLELRRGQDPFKSLESVKGIGSRFLQFDDFRLLRDRYVWDVLSRHEQTAMRESDRLYGDIRRALAFDTEHSRRYTQRMVDYFQGALTKNFELWRRHLETVDLEGRQTAGGLELINHGAAAVRVTLASGHVEMLPGRYLDTPGKLVLGSDAQLAELVLANEISGASIPISEVQSGSRDSGAGSGGPEAPTTDAEPAPLDPVQPPKGVRAVAEEWVFAGEIRLTETVALPEGIGARFEPGLRLILDPEVSLIIQGDLVSVGSEDRPIWVGAESIDAPFGVVAVLGRSHRPARVRLEHTTLQGGTEALFRGSYFSGMFSIYDGHLMMSHSRILDVRGEDGLNVKFGFIEARHNVIDRTFSDAVDLDFCRGVLENNTIRSAGGDSLDFSGSLVVSRNNLLEDTTDKGVSAGEATTAFLAGNQIRRATTGVASKDSSWVLVQGGEAEEVQLGMAVYQKKQIFGSGVIGFDRPIEAESSPFLADPLAWLHHLTDNAESGNLP